MRITTSYFCVKSYLKEDFDNLWNAFATHLGKEPDPEKVLWHWVLTEREVTHTPKSWTSLAKIDPKQYLTVGLQKGFLKLKLSLKADQGKVWHSESFSKILSPEEIVKAIARKSVPGNSKWNGASIDIYMPMHQKHPGLAEHAILGAYETEHHDIVWFVSDRPDPWSATMWHAYELNPTKRVAVSRLAVLDRPGQKQFSDCEEDGDFDFRDFKGRRLSEEQMSQALAGVKKFVWRMDRNGGVGAIPATCRKFKLGEEITEHERKATPVESMINALVSSQGQR